MPVNAPFLASTLLAMEDAELAALRAKVFLLFFFYF
jgi:hypothetical protein